MPSAHSNHYIFGTIKIDNMMLPFKTKMNGYD